MVCLQVDSCVGFDWNINIKGCFLHNSSAMLSERKQASPIEPVDQYVRINCTPGMS